jgi:hypothetical protein
VGEPAQQQDLPPTTTDDQNAPGATTEDEQESPAPSGAATAPGPGATAGPIEEKKLDQFADAKVKQTAESDMIAAVERSGLQVPEFNKIVERMASDTEMRSRVAAKLQERSGSKPDAGAKPNDTGG